jgi:hypothetical protein
MYCYHCGKEIDEHRIEAKKPSLINGEEVDENTTVSYVCPRCGWLIHKDASELEMKSLSAASHAEIQRGRNFFAQGMGYVCVGVISLIVAYVFFLLAHKANLQYQLIMSSPEFVTSMVLFAFGGSMFILGSILVIIGILKKHKYQELLKEINNKTFFQ